MVRRAPGLRSSRASKRRIGRGAEGAVALRQRAASGRSRIEHHRAVQRIGAVDRLELDQRGAAVGGARHRAQGGADRDLAVAVAGRRAPSASASRWISENERSPPRMTRPSRASPSVEAARRTSRRRRSPSRRARCRRRRRESRASRRAVRAAQSAAAETVRCDGERERHRTDASMRAASARFGMARLSRRCDRREQQQRHADHHAGEPDVREKPRSARRCRSGPRRS